MQTPAHTSTRRPRRALACLALALGLLISAALSSGASARTDRGRRHTCTAIHHARHGSRRCPKHHARKGSHQKKPASTAPAPKLIPAGCEDGTAPVRVPGNSFGCEDGSEPACEGGSEPFRPSASSPPMCRVASGGAKPECSGLGECGPEFACEAAEEEAVQASQGCEHGSAFEEESELES